MEYDPETEAIRESNQRHLTCGHTVTNKDHVWTTRNGADACRQECANRLEQRGR